MLWIEQLGTSAYELMTSVAADGSGGAWVAGHTRGALGGPNLGYDDAFLARYDVAGSPVWVRQFGTDRPDLAQSVTPDGADGVYVAGYTDAGALGGPPAGGFDAFLARFDADGNQLWARQLGTNGQDTASEVAPDGAGGAFIAGDTRGDLGGPNAGNYDAFVARFDDAGSLVWLRQIGSTGWDMLTSAAADGAGGVYVGGTTLGDLGGPNLGSFDLFVARYDSAGTLLWLRHFGTTTTDGLQSVAPDGAGGVYVAGYTLGALAEPYLGNGDAYLLRLDAAGNVIWGRQFGTTAGSEYAFSVALGAEGVAYVTGSTSGNFGEPNSGITDVFLIAYDAAGDPLWGSPRQFGTPEHDLALAVAVDDAGGVYLAGANTLPSSDHDGFLARLSDGGRVLWGYPGLPDAVAIPARSVRVRAYWVEQGNLDIHVIDYAQDVTLTNEDGRYDLPPELVSYPIQPGEVRRGLLAEFDYVEPYNESVSGPLRGPIRNYPQWNPIGSALRTQGLDNQDLVDRLDQVNRTIFIPYPVVFQPGVAGHGENSSVDLRGFLILDPADPAKVQNRLPAFPFFSMQSDDVASWGYENPGIRLAMPSEILDNAVRLQNYLTGRVYPEIGQFVGGSGSILPFSLGAHSYGGIISRKWMVLNRSGEMAAAPGVSDPFLPIPAPERYVSFDGVQGGTAWAMGLGITGFSERVLNGVSSPGLPPHARGWNYWNRLSGPATRQLLLSNDFDASMINGIINPWSSALGVGRTVLPFLGNLPSGYCERFVGGWLSYALFETHSIQTVEPVYRAAARFLAHGVPPEEGPDFLFTRTAAEQDALGFPGCTVVASLGPAVPEGVLALDAAKTVTASGSATFPTGPWEGATMRVQGRLEGDGAALEVLDAQGAPLPKSNDLTGQLGDLTIVSFDVTPDPGGGEMFRLTAGPVEDATFTGRFVHLDRPALAMVLDDLRASAGAPIPVLASLRDNQGLNLTDFTGVFKADLLGPEMRTTVLVDDGTGADLVAGDGVFSGELAAVSVPGSYLVQAFADGSSTAHGPLRRRDRDPLLIVVENAAVVSYLGHVMIDQDGNGLAEEALLRFQTAATAPGSYRVVCDLEGPAGDTYPVSAGVLVASVPDAPVVELVVPAVEVHRLGSGGYSARGVTMQDLAGDESWSLLGDVALGSLDPALFELLPPPRADTCVPDSGPFAGGNVILIRGAHLDSATAVRIGGLPAAFEVLADDVLSVMVPAWSVGNGDGVLRPTPLSGVARVKIRVVTPNGKSSLPAGYSYVFR